MLKKQRGYTYEGSTKCKTKKKKKTSAAFELVNVKVTLI